MTKQELITTKEPPAFSHAAEVVELHLLLPVRQFAALEAVAAQSQLTVATLLCRTIGDFLRPPTGAACETAEQTLPTSTFPKEKPMIHSSEGIAAATQSTGLPPANGSRSRPQSVLVIDNNKAVLVFLGVGLEASGFAVWLAANGQEGLAVCREHGSVIDFLVLDVCMPGWDGPETLAAIRTLAPDIPCCFMSGDTGRYTIDDLLGFGAFAVLQKPFQLDELISHFKRLSAQAERHGEGQDDHWDDDGGRG